MSLWTRLFRNGKDPDPVANQFLAHIEHVRKSGRIQPITLEWLDGMICDAVLGKHVRFIHTKFREVIEKVSVCEQTFTAAGYFNITTKDSLNSLVNLGKKVFDKSGEGECSPCYFNMLIVKQFEEIEGSLL